jgi:CrcB protein
MTAAYYLTHPCVLLMVGGGVGANLRYWLGVWFRHRGWTDTFPWHTFVINVVGSFVLGVVLVGCKDRPLWFALLGAGLCGGFTTFSTFSAETVQLVEADRIGAAAGYAAGSVLAAVLGAWAGIRVMK